MGKPKLGLKVGLWALAVGLVMAVGASVAQAEGGAKWNWEHGGSNGTFSNSLEATPEVFLENNDAELFQPVYLQ